MLRHTPFFTFCKFIEIISPMVQRHRHSGLTNWPTDQTTDRGRCYRCVLSIFRFGQISSVCGWNWISNPGRVMKVESWWYNINISSVHSPYPFMRIFLQLITNALCEFPQNFKIRKNFCWNGNILGNWGLERAGKGWKKRTWQNKTQADR